MKSWLPSILTTLLVCAAAAFAGPSPHDPADTFAFNSIPQIEHAALNVDNPLCDCKSCECLNCSCTPLEVGQPPDVVSTVSPIANLTPQAALVNIKSGEVTPYKEPPPGLIVPVKTVAKKAAPPAATGHWETRYAGIRGRRSYQVWVPDAAGGVCANGSCSSGAPANGSLPGYFGYSGGGSCRSCR